MDPHTLFLHLVLILISAKIAGEIASYFRAPAVIGELFAGILLGPSLFGIVSINESINLLSQIGIVLLLFEVGIETELGKLHAAGRKSLIVALFGVLFPFFLGFGISFYFFEFSALSSLFIASTLTATSIGITLRVFKDIGKQKSHEAQVIVGAAVLDDIIGIVLLSLLYEFTKEGAIELLSIARAVFFIALFITLSPFLAKGLSYLINKWHEKSKIPGLLPVAITSMILFFSWSAYSLGAPELLGGFVVGLALSKEFNFSLSPLFKKNGSFTSLVEHQMHPIIQFFTPIFFVGIGLSLNLKQIEWQNFYVWQLTFLLLLAAILGKFLSGFFLKKESFTSKCIIGTAMVPRGEVGLIFASVGLSAGALTNDLYTSLVLVITITTLLAPFALRSLYKN